MAAPEAVVQPMLLSSSLLPASGTVLKYTCGPLEVTAGIHPPRRAEWANAPSAAGRAAAHPSASV